MVTWHLDRMKRSPIELEHVIALLEPKTVVMQTDGRPEQFRHDCSSHPETVGAETCRAVAGQTQSTLP